MSLAERTFLWALAPVPAVAVGALLAERIGASHLVFAPNALAVFLGLCAVAAAHGRLPKPASRLASASAVLAALLIALTLADRGMYGVHRWLALGPLRVHASAALAPWLLFGALFAPSRALSLAALLFTQLVHLAQPDAAQATALAVGALPLLLDRTVVAPREGRATALAMVALACATWLRPDPLWPVEHVEGVFRVARTLGPLWLALVAAALACALAPFVSRTRATETITNARGLSAARMATSAVLYLSTAWVATTMGPYPVALFGAGAAPVFGWFALAVAQRIADTTTPERTAITL
jgi:hypothetical protein